MRIAIVAEVFLPKIDGVVHRTMNLIRQLLFFGDEVLVICPQAKGCVGCPVPVVQVPSFSFPLYPEYRVALPNKDVVAALEGFAPDVIHYVNPFAFGFRCYDLLHRAGVRTPTVFSFHTLYGEFVKKYRLLRPLSALLWWLMREYHNRADVNITVSSIMKEELCKRGFERVRCWPPAVDVDLFSPVSKSPAMRARLAGGHEDKKLLLTVSRLAPEKNVEFLAGVLDRVPEACLAVVGDGPHRAALERRFAGKAVHFVGYLKGAELASAYASADAFVYASETETMGNVVLEAMASGCPVVAPRAGGIPSLLRHDETGTLYSPGNLDEAVACTRKVLFDGPFQERLAAAARDWVADWGWSASIREVRQLYQEAMSSRCGDGRGRRGRQKLAGAIMSALVHGFKMIAPRNGPDPVQGEQGRTVQEREPALTEKAS
jgi:glycosyltransferase involved in cell wall biosynthesis